MTRTKYGWTDSKDFWEGMEPEDAPTRWVVYERWEDEPPVAVCEIEEQAQLVADALNAYEAGS